MKISVVIPTRNRLEVVTRNLALTSRKVGREGSEGVEILVLDNASDFDIQKLVELADIHPAVRVMRNAQNLGLAGSVYKALEEASGDFLFFCSDEDVIDAEALLRCDFSGDIDALIVAVERDGSRYSRFRSSRLVGPSNLHRASHYLSGVGFRKESMVEYAAFLNTKLDNDFVFMYPHMALLACVYTRGGSIRFDRRVCVSSGVQFESDFGGHLSYSGPVARVAHAVGVSDLVNDLHLNFNMKEVQRKELNRLVHHSWKKLPSMLLHDLTAEQKCARSGLNSSLGIGSLVMRWAGKVWSSHRSWPRSVWRGLRERSPSE